MSSFQTRRDLFDLPEGITYLDGNSLGPLPKSAVERARATMAEEWGPMLITGWNKARWMDLPGRLGDRIGRLIGAPAGSTVVGDTLSIKVYQAVASAVEMRPGRKIVLSDNGNFPSDLYMADGLLKSLKQGHELKVVDPEAVAENITEDVAAVMLTHVDYRTGRVHDMKAITDKAHAAGAIMIWDLAHSAGALPVDLTGCNADIAVGCTYKYLNGGPGAPGFIHVRPDLIDQVRPALSGWLGHQAPFAFDLDYRPGEGISRMRVGTPPVIQMAVLDAALDAFDGVDMTDIRARSIELSEQFISEVETGCKDVELASPRDPQARGSQVSFRFHEGYAAMQALIARGIIGDFRAPDIMRFGFCPLYNTAEDVSHAAAVLCEIIATGEWDRPEFKQRKAVT
ncbi:kynureninase [Hoeflea alexandrii]|uniref:Kynureninase n=1 Tax=Hoeflea alexandrii TaxID=288436 RepID=A0ABT1CNM1_9HYPH|nr:kynureninase [Hoeflea alexandrii]MCO6407784.1 kynureninase [Hoeflea alexandrii]MCY0153848.1 kynureninase [Hoeflea alexandrii]